MKVLILSDSHHSSLLTEILKKERSCDVFLHLGDGAGDMLDTSEFTGCKPVYTIKGNCDAEAYNFPVRLTSYIGDIKFYACHGHTHNVKSALTSLYYAAKEAECAIAFFGHTHTAHNENYDGITLFNPGSVRNGCYGILQIDSNGFSLRHCTLY